MSEVNMEMAKTMFGSICSTLDNMKLNYQVHEDDLALVLGHKGDDMEHNILVLVDAEKEVIRVVERLPFKMNPDKASDIAMAVCNANERLLVGSFSYDMQENLTYNITQIYNGSLIGEEAIKRMILTLAFTVEDFDDKFMALNKGYLKPDAFKD